VAVVEARQQGVGDDPLGDPAVAVGTGSGREKAMEFVEVFHMRVTGPPFPVCEWRVGVGATLDALWSVVGGEEDVPTSLIGYVYLPCEVEDYCGSGF
jgi:hypothetical protein